jgi:CRISPR system Cascade subunit CasD
MHVVFLPKPKCGISEPQAGRSSDWLEPWRTEDYHTVGGGFDPQTHPYSVPWTASGQPDKDSTVTRREYLLDARFGVILEGPCEVLSEAAQALRDPVWGVWLGRKSCVPAAPLITGGPFSTREEAWKALLGQVALSLEMPFAAFGGVEEIGSNEGYLTVSDQPVSFGDGTSSGPDRRVFAMRRIRVAPGRATEDRGPQT